MAYLNSQFDCGIMTSEAECLRAYYAHTLGDSVNGGYVALDTELDIPAGIEHQLRTLQALYDSSPYCQPETTVCPEFEGTEPCLENEEVILRYHGGRNRLRIQELVPALQSLVASGY
ncbi:MAG: uncharacterized protein KVP18_002134 [Porospora cf. gigantea A]|uniref:uncharacterized protein n=1 Tax=Porospora cf. gigantea A TaxID=2853593 RepID=UPI00355970FB|nr:MAG: hypothetical protein KVP18_002134 [Porospora cf. gigantea A]